MDNFFGAMTEQYHEIPREKSPELHNNFNFHSTSTKLYFVSILARQHTKWLNLWFIKLNAYLRTSNQNV